MAHARGVILETIASRSLPIIEPTPLELKSSLTGDGQADKRQMQDMLKLLLKIEEIPAPMMQPTHWDLRYLGPCTTRRERCSLEYAVPKTQETKKEPNARHQCRTMRFDCTFLCYLFLRDFRLQLRTYFRIVPLSTTLTSAPCNFSGWCVAVIIT